jgi:hypothetical protein
VEWENNAQKYYSFQPYCVASPAFDMIRSNRNLVEFVILNLEEFFRKRLRCNLK